MPRKRADDLLFEALDWLRNDDGVQARLGDIGEVVTYGQVADPDDGPDLAPVSVAVTAIPGNSERNNKQEDKTFVLEVEVSASNTWIGTYTTRELNRLAGDVADAVAVHRDGWGFGGASGGSGAVSPDPDRPRYSAVRRFDFSRHDPAVAHD